MKISNLNKFFFNNLLLIMFIGDLVTKYFKIETFFFYLYGTFFKFFFIIKQKWIITNSPLKNQIVFVPTKKEK